MTLFGRVINTKTRKTYRQKLFVFYYQQLLIVFEIDLKMNVL